MDVSLEPNAGEWDRFLVSVPGSHHLQSSLWAELKARSGWQPLRLALRENGDIIAGVQILSRSLPLLGRAGYAPRGPVFRDTDPSVHQRLFAELDAGVRARGFRYLAVQPPRCGAGFSAQLVAGGFRPAPYNVAPTVTLLVEVRKPKETLLREMRHGTRYGVRKGLERGLTARTGDESDLPAFHSLLASTGKRRGFSPRPLDYFRHMWRLFARSDGIVLFLVELEGTAVAAELDIAFGDTLVAKRAGWSGEHARLHPNELVVWTALNWARERGLRYYDQEGLDPRLARELSCGGLPIEGEKRSPSWFKAGFGGEIVFLPENHELVYTSWANRAFRIAGRHVRRRLSRDLGLV